MRRHIGLTGLLALPLAFVLYGQGCSPGAALGTDSTDNQASTVRHCSAPAGVSAAPKTIEEAVALINSLPRPVTVPCFVESLDRPLKIYATSSTFSAQPAAGTRSPRIFIFSDKLIISVVPDGVGKDLIEFSLLNSDQTSLKGELQFPVTEALSVSKPYDRILSGTGGTNCMICHSNEKRAAEITYAEAYVSTALKPRPANRVGLVALEDEAASCDRSREPARCDMLHAIFGHGEVTNQDFPSTLQSF